MNKTTNIKSILVLIIILNSIIFAFSIKPVSSTSSIWLEAEDAVKIAGQIEIFDNSEASGGKAIVSKVPSHQTEAYAKYELPVELSGTYQSWINCYWPGGCNNAYYFQLDNSVKILVGNDNLTDQWHWIRGPQYNLQKGKHQFTIWNDEIDAWIDMLLFTTDFNYIPVGISGEHSYQFTFEDKRTEHLLFNDGARYSIVQDTLNATSALCLAESVKDKLNYVLVDVNAFNNFVYNFSIRSDSIDDNDIRIILNFKNSENYSYLQLDSNDIRFIHISNKNMQVMDKADDLHIFKNNDYQNFSLIRRGPDIILKQNNKNIYLKKNVGKISGKIGLVSMKNNLFIKDMEYIINMRPALEQTFFTKGKIDRLKQEPGFDLYYFNGKWTVWPTSKGNQYLIGKSHGIGEKAFFVFGYNYFQNYSLSFAAKMDDNRNGLGAGFYWQNENNHYQFRCIRKDSRQVQQLVKVVEGDEIIIDETYNEFQSKNWYRFDIQIKNGKIKIYVDKKLILEAEDKTFDDGNIALLSFSENSDNCFDDIIVKNLTNFGVDSSHSYNYTFEPRENAGFELSDWILDNDIINGTFGIRLEQQKRNRPPYRITIKKDIFKNPGIFHKHIFNGNHLEIETKLWKSVAKDVDANFYFSTALTTYEIAIKPNAIQLLRNHELLISKQHSGIRQNLAAVYDDGVFSVNLGDRNVFSYSTDDKLSDVKIGFGYSGIGKTEILPLEITIKD